MSSFAKPENHNSNKYYLSQGRLSLLSFFPFLLYLVQCLNQMLCYLSSFFSFSLAVISSQQLLQVHLQQKSEATAHVKFVQRLGSTVGCVGVMWATHQNETLCSTPQLYPSLSVLPGARRPSRWLCFPLDVCSQAIFMGL